MASTDSPAATTANAPVLVTADNFNRAETDKYFGDFVKRGALGRFWHFRELPSIDIDSVRPNRDTLYSHAVFDLDAGPATITLPDAGKRFMSMIVIDEDRKTPELSADREGLELHGAALSSTSRIVNGTWKFPEAQPLEEQP